MFSQKIDKNVYFTDFFEEKVPNFGYFTKNPEKLLCKVVYTSQEHVFQILPSCYYPNPRKEAKRQIIENRIFSQKCQFLMKNALFLS